MGFLHLALSILYCEILAFAHACGEHGAASFLAVRAKGASSPCTYVS